MNQTRAAAFVAITAGMLLLPPRWAHAGVNSSASIWLVEPGDRTPQWFGHVFLCFDDRGPDPSLADCYNFGALASPGESFLSDFLGGRAEYRTEVRPAVRVSARYRNEHRHISRLSIRTTHEVLERLRLFVDVTYPVQQRYIYRPFADNCTTRLVEALRSVVGPDLQSSVAIGSEARASIRAQLVDDLNRGAVQRASLILLIDSLLGGVDTVSRGLFLPSQLTPNQSPPSALPTTLWRGAFVSALAAAGLASRKRGGGVLFAGLLTTLAITAWAARWLGGMPEMAANQAWLLYCPLDCCLFGENAWSRRYLWLRVTVIAALMVASLLGTITQPLFWPGGALTAALLARVMVQSSGGLLHEARRSAVLGLRELAGLRQRW
jgi:hypothetical protein